MELDWIYLGKFQSVDLIILKNPIYNNKNVVFINYQIDNYNNISIQIQLDS